MPDGPSKDDFVELYNELRAEVDLLAKAVLTEKGEAKYPDPVGLSQIDRRLLVRSIFAFIEATVYGMKQLALESLRASSVFSIGEMALAKEEDYELNDTGLISVRPARLRFLSNLRFAFRLLARSEKIDFKLDVSGKHWQALRRSILVRDRLMHPKRTDDLLVTDDEIRNALGAVIWVDSQFALILVQIVRRLRLTLSAAVNRLAELEGTDKDEGPPSEE